MFTATALATLALASPALGDARTPPTELAYLQPHASVTYAHGRSGYNCQPRGWFSDMQAYRWNGSAMPAQRRTRDGYRWGRVTFDGITFRNGSRAPVLVAGWCE